MVVFQKVQNMKSLGYTFALISCGAWLTMAAQAQPFTNTTSTAVNLPVPDNDLSGISSSINLSSPITQITDVNVTLNISGGFNGDLYAYLTHSSGFAVLLNRAGRSAGTPLGYPDSGFNITLDDQAGSDVHNYRAVTNPNGGALAGTWQPDARNLNPQVTFDTTPRDAFLSSFNGTAASGNWTLFVADVSPGSVANWNSWGMTIVGVPEPATWTLMGLGALGAVLYRRRRQ